MSSVCTAGYDVHELLVVAVLDGLDVDMLKRACGVAADGAQARAAECPMFVTSDSVSLPWGSEASFLTVLVPV